MLSITDGIYYQDVYAGVVLGAVILPEGTLVIDTPFRPDQARAWKSLLLSQSQGKFHILINLDEHVDRTLGNRYIDLPILAHHNTFQVIANRTNIFKGQQPETGSEWEKYPEMIGARWTTPDITFTESLSINWSKTIIQIDHRPGPASGTSWVEIPEKQVIFIGDSVLLNEPPFLAEADIPLWLESLSMLRRRKYKDYIIVSGRSGLVSNESIKSQQALLRSILGRLDRLAKRNAPPKDTAKMVPALMEKLDFSQKDESVYSQRLIYGLREYYKNHYENLDETAQES
jgi:glyoxylase-like metal-dependent hydrolase (beta-lactamase superfamily II)